MASPVDAVHGPVLSDAEWHQFLDDGFLRLGRVYDDAEVAAMNTRLEDL